MNRLSRRGALRAAALTVGTPLLGTVGETRAGSERSATSSGWPMFSHDQRNSGHSPSVGPKRDVSKRWSFRTGGAIESSPVVADGTAYVGSNDGSLYALGAESGEPEWEFETGGDITSAPAVVDGGVYVGSHDATLYALDAASGELQWSFETGDRIGASPTVKGDTLYLGSYDNSLYAIDAASGEERWATGTGSIITSSTAVVDGTVYFGSADNSVYALDTADGSRKWVFETGNGVNSSPAVVDGRVYVGSSDGYNYALDAETGRQEWEFSIGGIGGPSPAAAGGRVYVSEGVAGKDIHAVDAASGDRIWTGQTGGSVRSSPAVADGVVYVGSDDATLYAIDAAGGSLLWGFEAEEGISSSPAVVGDTVYVGSNDRRLYAITGARTSRTPTDTVSPTPGGASTRTPTAASGGGVFGDDLALYVPALLGALGLGGGGAWWVYGRDPDDDGTPPAAASTQRKEPDEIPTVPDVSVDYDALVDETPIGSGGNADVTRATARTSEGDVQVAIKKPRLSGTLHVEAIEGILAEAGTWAKLDDHDHIVGVVDYGSEPLPWIAMEYMDGGHLGERANGMDTTQALWTAMAVTNGVHHAHRRGVAHLDLKPENVLFRTVEGAWDVPKVSDWGLAKHLLDHSKSVEGLTSQYAAPEQFDEAYGTPDDITDVYQLGTLFYELFTGRPPFEESPADVMRAVLEEQPRPPSEVADVPPALDDVLLTALAKEKADRYDSLVYLRDALQTLYNEQ